AACALYLFPTKALAQDQLAELRILQLTIDHWPSPSDHRPLAIDHRPLTIDHSHWATAASLAPAVYDGDTPASQRSRIRSQARLVLTNPDMLHVGILPHHPRWARFLAHLRFVVLDEMHAYRGVFGSHVANVLRRLRRLCRFYGAREPQFLCASATVANPHELAERLIEAPVTVIADDGSPKGERHIVFYNPPLVDRALGLRRSSAWEAERLAERLLAEDVQTVVFARSRLAVELLLTSLRERTTGEGIGREGTKGKVGKQGREGNADAPFPPSIAGYRSGYLPSERRAVEAGLRSGAVRAVVATNALELGVNIGGLDAAILTGFPGTVASTWQQMGRAGRRNAVSLAVLIASAGPLDQYIVRHPDYFFGRSPEHALINPDNLAILSSHLACAAFELPFRRGERFGRVDFTEEVLAFLAESGQVQQHAGDWFWMGPDQPAQRVSLRTASPDNVVIHAMGEGEQHTHVVGELERSAAPMLLYEGAVYLHGGDSYLVERLDWENGHAWVRPAAVDYYTVASGSQRVQVLNVSEQRERGGLQWTYGAVHVVSRYTAYRKIKRHTHETLGYGAIDLPEQVLDTDAYWIAFAESLLEPLRAAGRWRSDPNDYGPNWPQQRDAARARDGYRCTLCGAAERPGRQHDVHHKRAFRSFGYIPGRNDAYLEANRLDNLVTLCRPCHQAVERGQRLRTGLGGLAYALGHVAPLRLMCDPSDLGVVSEASASGSGLPTVTVYEKAPAGIGFSRRLFELSDELLVDVADLIAACPCTASCPACVGPAPEHQESELDPKALTLALVRACLATGPASLAESVDPAYNP
ncbi:MAG: DUF1998 domain-containing protein, partial [Anaerolineae bacterium]|nr:DUF1998 domain-containing protein [Anaerolineae bacterium]